MDELQTQEDVHGFSDDVLNTLALQSVHALVLSLDVALGVFGKQLTDLHIADDLRMCRKVLARVLAKLD